MKLNNATESFGPAAEGWHQADLAVETGFAKTATVVATKQQVKDTAPQLRVTATLLVGADKGKTVFDNLMTDDMYAGAGIAKAKLRDLGIREVDQDLEVPDAKIASDLNGRRVFVYLKQQQQTTQDPVSGLWNVPKTFTDKNGVTTPSMKNVIEGYSLKDPQGSRDVPSAALIADIKAKAKAAEKENSSQPHAAEPWAPK